MSWKIEHKDLQWTDIDCVLVSQYTPIKTLTFYPITYRSISVFEKEVCLNIGVWKIKNKKNEKN